MTDRIMEWLDKSQRLADEATKGPWEVYGYNVLAHLGPGNCNGCSGILSPAHLPECGLYEVAGAGKLDAEFIAETRTRFPQAVAALRAIMESHRRLGSPHMYEFHDGPRALCRGCMRAGVLTPTYPCETRRLAEVALGLGGDGDEQ